MSSPLIPQYEELHRTRAYGDTSAKGARWILPHIRLLRPRTVIDYGCGQSVLADIIAALGPTVIPYDPAIPEYGHVDSVKEKSE